jgi:hypothetical protein
MTGHITAAELGMWIDALERIRLDVHGIRYTIRDLSAFTGLLSDRRRELLAIEARSDVNASLFALGSVATGSGSSMAEVAQAERDIVTIVRRMAREAAEAGKGEQ